MKEGTRIAGPRTAAQALLSMVLAQALTLGTARADDAPGLPSAVAPGQRVRVTAEVRGQSSHHSIRGTLVALTHDSVGVVIDGDLGGAPVQLPVRAISKIEVSRGHKRHALAGALAGFAVGVAGAAFALILAEAIRGGAACTTTNPDCNSNRGLAAGALEFGLVTTSIGGLVGYSVRTEQWRRVDLPAPDTSGRAIPGPDGRVTVRLPALPDPVTR